MARSVTLTCATCGFLMPIGGPLGQAFGVCAQEMSPSDGSVVSLAYGCGAHAEVVPIEREAVGSPTQDFVGFDALDLDQVDDVTEDAEVAVDIAGIADVDAISAAGEVEDVAAAEVDAEPVDSSDHA